MKHPPALTEDRLAWLALALTPKIGPRRILRAVERCGPGQNSRVCAHRTRITAISRRKCAVYLPRQRPRAADQQIDALAKTGAPFLTYVDAVIQSACVRYSIRLRCSGFAAMRSCSRSLPSRSSERAIPLLMDRAWPRCFRVIWPHRGLIILSGMARGVDTAAHKGAIAAKRPTVAIWGTGIDVIYPKENKSLGGADRRWRRRDRLGVPAGNVSRAAKFSPPQPNPERNERRRAGGRGRRAQRHAGDGALRASSRTATSTPFPATSPQRMPGGLTR